MALALLLAPGVARAGPPFVTDDPEPVDYQHWEFYTFSAGTGIAGDTSGAAGAFEFNYGFMPNAMTHIIVPALSFDAPAGGGTQFGYGDTELGVKYRFVKEDKNGALPAIGVFPLAEIPSGDRRRGLGAGYTRFFLPIWLQKTFGAWTTYGGGGYWFNRNKALGDKNYWFVGWLLQRQITDKLALGGELFYQTVSSVTTPDNLNFNLGGIYDFNAHNHLLFSVGRGLLRNSAKTNAISWYVGYQITY